MQRHIITPRNNWQNEVEKLGFGFHTTNVPYWEESKYYSFSLDEINKIEIATQEIYEMCLEAVQYVIDEELYDLFKIPKEYISLIESSWSQDSPAIYGRFDLCYKDGKIKLLEFNADTPTSLFECGIVQWYWLKDFNNSKDQFNSIHEKLINYWEFLKNYLYRDSPLYFTCVKNSLEDLTTTEYLRDCAIQAGIDTKLIFIEDIGFDGVSFRDLKDNEIKNIFKLYPWENLITEDFGKHIEHSRSLWIEPAWKMILSNKAILPILFQLFPDSEYLLPTFFESKGLTNYVKKPIFSREGANIEIFKENKLISQTLGEYGKEGYIYQQLFELPNFDGNFPVIGSWIIGQEPAGMGIRESGTLITNNSSKFIPHLINE